MNKVFKAGATIIVWEAIRRSFFKGLQAAKDRVTFVEWKLRNLQFDLDGATAEAVITLKNDLPFTIPDNSFKGDLVLGDTAIAPLELGATDLIAGDNRAFTFNVDIPYRDLRGDLISIIQNPNQLLAGITLKGNLVSNGIIIPINQRLI